MFEIDSLKGKYLYASCKDSNGGFLGDTKIGHVNLKLDKYKDLVDGDKTITIAEKLEGTTFTINMKMTHHKPQKDGKKEF